MDCDRVGDDGLQADKMDLLYGEADAAARARVEAHLAGCAPCREEMGELRAVRRDLGAWRLPAARPSFTPRGVVLPRWLAAAAVLLLGLGSTLGVAGYASLRRSLVAQEARAAALEQQHRVASLALAALERRPAPPVDSSVSSPVSTRASTRGCARARRGGESAWTRASRDGRSAPRRRGGWTWPGWPPA